ncbi:armadillo-type protein [Mycena olivaceomarginata]|nr:armadillo-type protein [Mycena olivaceomarginata]
MNDRQAVQLMKKDHDLPLSTKSTKLFLSWLEYPNVGASTKNKILKHIAKKEVSDDDALEVAKSLLIHSGVIHQFLLTSDLQLQTYACDVLINLALKPSSAAVVVQANPCSSLVSLSHGVTPTLTVRALRALYLIAKNANGGRAVIQAGALNYLDKLFSSSNMEVWAATCDMLWSLAIVDSTLESVVRAGPSRGLVTVLRGKDTRVVHKAATILALIAESEEGAQAVIAAGLLDLLDVIIQLPDQTTICLVVQQLGSHDSTRNSVLTSNLCRHIISLLHNDANVPHALGALRSIAKFPEPVQAVLDAEILYVLGRLFESTDSKVRREACGLMGDLAICKSTVLQDPDASARSTAVGVLMTLAAHFGFEETTGAIIPRLLSILRWDDDLYVRYTTAVSLDKLLEYRASIQFVTEHTSKPPYDSS